MSPETTASRNETWLPTLDVGWEEVRSRFLDAVAPAQRARVDALLHETRGGGLGLRTWLNCIAAGACMIPDSIPPEVIQIYFDHPDAMPLHDCANCGLRVPVIPSREYGFEGEPEQVFFPECPRCGGRTGWYQYLANETHPKPDNRGQ